MAPPRTDHPLVFSIRTHKHRWPPSKIVRERRKLLLALYAPYLAQEEPAPPARRRPAA